MKRIIAILLAMLVLLAPAWAAPKASAASAELDVGAAVEIPGFAVGACVEYLDFVWSIDIDSGLKNQLGWGLFAGLMWSWNASTLQIPLQGVVVGRFGFVEDMPLDMTARLGVWILPGDGVVFAGGFDIAATFGGNFKASAGINFMPAGSFIGWSALLTGTYVIPMK